MIAVGAALGVLIGVLSGVMVLLLLYTMFRSSAQGTQLVLAITGELSAIPAFMFGGSWVTSLILEDSWSQIANPYIISLSLTFLLIVLYPLILLVIRVGNLVGAAEATASQQAVATPGQETD